MRFRLVRYLGAFEKVTCSQKQQPRLLHSARAGRQLSLTIHLNPAAAVLGQTSFLLCLLADKISDRLWLWFSFGLHVQCSVKILVQPAQHSFNRRESKCNGFSLNNISVAVLSVDHGHSWTAPIWSQTAHSSGLSTWSVFKELALQIGSCVSLLLLVPPRDCQTHQCSCSLTGKLCICSREKCLTQGFFQPWWQTWNSKNTTVHIVLVLTSFPSHA